MDQSEFANLSSAAGQGDERAFATLYRAYQPGVRRYLVVVVGAWAADDAAAEVWLDVARGIGRFRGSESGFRRWLFTIARHRGLDVHRRRRRQPEMAPLEEAWTVPAPGPGAADQALDRLSSEDALAIIATLPPQQAEIIALRLFADLDADGVGKVVGKSAGAVRVASHRGLRTLAQRLDRQGGDHPGCHADRSSSGLHGQRHQP